MTDWMRHAACRGATATMFPEYGPGLRRAIAEAKAICAVCVVRQPCLQYALDNNIRHGIFGGMTVKERHPRRRKRDINGRRHLTVVADNKETA